jgi:hypothetical protein
VLTMIALPFRHPGFHNPDRVSLPGAKPSLRSMKSIVVSERVYATHNATPMTHTPTRIATRRAAS